MTNANSLDNPKSIQWVAFDAVGTLIFPATPVAETYHRIGKKYDTSLSREEVASRFRSEFARSEEVEVGELARWNYPACLKTDESRENSRWREIVGRVLDDVDRPEECFKELFAEFGRASAWSCYPDVRETLSDLQSRGYCLAIASNFDSRLHSIRAGLSDLAAVERIVVSSEAGYRKPSRYFFEALASALQCDIGELLLVGDDAINDIAGGQAAGLQVLEINRAAVEPRAGQISSLLEVAKRLQN